MLSWSLFQVPPGLIGICETNRMPTFPRRFPGFLQVRNAMDRARMNSAIRVFNDAVVANDSGGMVSEKVRGLIATYWRCASKVERRELSSRKCTLTATPYLTAKNVARAVRACPGPGCDHGCRLPSPPRRAAGVRGHREA